MEVALSQGAAKPRNVACECGSGLRHKNCCGWLNPELPAPERIAEYEGAFARIQAAMDSGRVREAESMCVELLNMVPGHARTMGILAQIHRQTGRFNSAQVLYKRVVALLPQHAGAAGDLAMLLYDRGNLLEAEPHARNMLRLDPDNPQAHNLMGMILTDSNRYQAGEFHYRKALKLHPPVGKLCANLGVNLKNQGKLDEAEQMYEQAMKLEPDNMASLMGWIRVKEAGRRIDDAWKLYEQAKSRIPTGNLNLCMTRAILHRRNRELDEALTALDEADPQQQAVSPPYHYERGYVLDRLERYDEAFASFAKANEIIRERAGRTYVADQANQLASRLKAFFTRQRAQRLPRGIRGRNERAAPIFIVGFPRSGTTMVEQILTTLDAVSAGDELPFIWQMTAAVPKMLNSNLFYPECLIDLLFGDNQAAPETLRDFYLKKVYQLNVLQPGAEFFTDKMPLNETNLGLIHLVFPEAPVVHLIRHPLDVVLSSFFNDFTHGNNCSYGLESAAQHFALVRDLVDHYLDNLDVNYLPIRYEDVVAEPEQNCRKLLNFIGLEWDPKCLAFHRNPRYARTASYAQVTESLYDRSVFRYRNYIDHLGDVIPILQPVIERLGYEI